jgi:pimeloyl-ACP methyl ester carboxylesterase
VVLIHEPDETANPNEPIFYEDRVAFASRLPKARVVVAEDSNHFIQTQRPDLVIQSIQDLVLSVRTGEPLAQ